MREILFRGKTKDFEWNYSSAIFPIDETVSIMLNERKPVLGVYDKTPDGEHYVLFNFTEVYSNTIGQYTGLTDKNGKKIFEGDIVEFTDKYRRKGRSDIVFEDLKWKYRWRYYCENPIVWIGIDVSSVKFEVIGNIYDNPELLEEKK